jgi:hypothetical protein
MVESKTRLAAAAGGVIVIGAVVAFSLHRPKPAASPAPAAAVTAAPGQAATPSAGQSAGPADCLLPGPPPVPPNGAIATASDMKLGHDVMQHFVDELEAYQTCRNAQIDHAGKAVSDQQKETWLEQGNEAVDQAHALADAFSAQLRVFKARPGSPP